jgi:hypothetical protein
MTHCTRCDIDVQPFGDMQADGRIVSCCPKCTGALAVTSLATATTERGTPKAVKLQVTPPGAMAMDPVNALTARLAAIDAQIPTPAQLKALKTERAGLMRALRALGADPAPKPN